MDGGALTFAFAPGGLREVVALLNRQRASGSLRIAAGEDRGALHLQGGQVVAAFYNAVSGPAALSRLMVCGPGRGGVEAIPAVVEPNLAGDTAALLARIDRVLAEVHFDDLFGSAPASAQPAAGGPPTAAGTATASLSAAELDAALGAPPVSDDPEMTMRTALLPPQCGSLLGRCLIKRQLGEGASSVVYLAHHTALDVDVVVKVLLPGAAGAGSDAVAMTTNEARILARLNHPNILRVFDFDETDRFPYLVMEHVGGGSLQAMMHERPRLEAASVVGILRQAVNGLAHAHDRVGLVHGDLKPGNLLVDYDGCVKLIDFGIAAIHQGRDRFATAAHRVVRGTPLYLAPELVEHPGRMAWASDCYALGATAYHALAGRPPYQHDDPLQLMLMHSTAGYVPLDVVRGDLDPRLVAIVHRCLHLRAGERYPSPAELLAELTELDEVAGGTPRGGLPGPRRTTMWEQLQRALRRS